MQQTHTQCHASICCGSIFVPLLIASASSYKHTQGGEAGLHWRKTFLFNEREDKDMLELCSLWLRGSQANSLISELCPEISAGGESVGT